MTQTQSPLTPVLAPGSDTGISDTDALTNQAEPTLIGTAVAGAMITLLDTDGTTVLGTATASSTGAYSVTADTALDDGAHQLSVTATAAGFDPSPPSASLEVTIDTAAPDAPTAPALSPDSDTGVSSLDGVTAADSLVVTGLAEAGAQVQLFADGGSAPVGNATADDSGLYSVTVTGLAEGVHGLTAVATDAAGNVGTASAATSVTIDTTAPDAPPAPTLAPASDGGVLGTDGLTNASDIVLTGTAEPGATVRLSDNGDSLGAAVQADATGRYVIAVPVLDSGPHAFTVAATDAAGNAGPASAALNIVVDTAEGTATSVPLPGFAGAPTATFTVHFDQPVSGVDLAAFKLTATGSAYGTIQNISGSGQTYSVVVSGLGGMGGLALDLTGVDARTAAGNPVRFTESDYHLVSGTELGFTTVVSTNSTGGEGSVSSLPTVSASGRLVAFASTDSALAPGLPADDGTYIYVKDLQTGGITRVLPGLAGTLGNPDSTPSLSRNADVIAFDSDTALTDDAADDGTINTYVARLALADPASGQSVTLVPGSITLVSQGNRQQGSGQTGGLFDNTPSPLVSADGNTVVFSSTAALTYGTVSGLLNVYSYDIASKVLTLVTAGSGPGEGGDAGSDVTSVSRDGQIIAFTSRATNIGDTGPVPVEADGEAVYPERGYIYYAATQQTFVLDGTNSFFGDTDPSHYDVTDVSLSADGTHAAYVVEYETSFSSVFVVDLSTLGAADGPSITQVTPAPVQGAYEGNIGFNDTPSLSQGGGLVMYTANSLGTLATEPAAAVTVVHVADGTTQTVGTGAGVLSAGGNAAIYESGTGTDARIFETSLGVTAAVATIGRADMVGAAFVAQAAATGTFTVTGTTNAPATSTVIVLFADVAIASASAAAFGFSAAVRGSINSDDGTWSANLPASFLTSVSDGHYAIVVQIGTSYGNSFQGSGTRYFTVDTTPPATPVAPVLAVQSDTGLLHDGHVTASATPVLTGVAEARSTVTLYDRAAPAIALAVTTADANGVYAVTAPVQAQGPHTFFITATDAAGNASLASANLAVTVDTIAPDQPGLPVLAVASDTGASNSDGLTSDTTPTLTGQAEPGTAITLHDTDGIAVLGTATAGANGQYSITTTALTDGTHDLSVTATDAAGNRSVASQTVALVIDTHPPGTPAITGEDGTLFADGKIAPFFDVVGTAEPGSTVALHIDGDDTAVAQATVDDDGAFTISVDQVQPGVHSLTVLATDLAGNVSQVSLPASVTVVGQPAPPPAPPPDTPTLTGLGEDGVIAGATVFADANGNGVLDAGEASTVTSLAGSFTLAGGANTPLVLTGGKDDATGLTLPGILTAPGEPNGPSEIIISPLTTLLEDTVVLTGLGVQAASDRLEQELGFASNSNSSIQSLDAVAAALPALTINGLRPGFYTPEIVNAALADTATGLSAVIASAAGQDSLRPAAFAAVFAAAARAANAGTLDLDTPAGVSALLSDAAGQAAPGLAIPAATVAAATQVIAAGNAALAALPTYTNDPTTLNTLAAIEQVEQGAVAPVLASGATGQFPALVASFTGSNLQAAIALAAKPLAAPLLTAASDTGFSHSDDNTLDDTPVFTGTALPGTLVSLEVDANVDGGDSITNYSQYPTAYVIGTGVADASGHYTIQSASLLETTHAISFETNKYFIVSVTAVSQDQATVGAIVESPLLGSIPNTLVTQSKPSGYFYDAFGRPEISGVTAVTVPGGDGSSTPLLVYGSLEVPGGVSGTVDVYADGSTIPIGTGISQIGQPTNSPNYAIQTAPLAAGQHTLVVTDTIPDGAVFTSEPFTLTVTAPALVSGRAVGLGALAGATVYVLPSQLAENSLSKGVTAGRGDEDPTAITAQDGSWTVPVPGPSDVIALEGGIDALTGLPLGGGSPELQVALSQLGVGVYTTDSGPKLLAPATATVIDALTLLVAETPPATYSPDPLQNTLASERQVLAALGLPAGLDLLGTDPLAAAQAGDPALLVANAKLLDTLTLLAPLQNYTFFNLGFYIRSHGTIDLDNAGQVQALLSDTADGSRSVPAADSQFFANLVADSNSALDAAAQAASGLTQLLPAIAAVERVAQTTEVAAATSAYTQLTNARLLASQTGSSTNAAPYLDPVTAAFTGPALQAAIAAAGSQMLSIVSFAADGPASTNAATAAYTITFNQPVGGLTPADFAIDAGGDLTGAQILAVTDRAGSGGTQWDVTVSTGIGAGLLGLTYTAGALQDAHGKPLTSGAFETSRFYGSDSEGNLSEGVLPADGIVLGDFNGDGRSDILTITPDAGLGSTSEGQTSGTYSLQVLLNGGGGTFTHANLGVHLLSAPTGVAVGDFNGDGKLDVVVASANFDTASATASTSALTVLLGNGDGTFSAPILLAQGGGATRVAVGDLNGDGRADIVTNGGPAGTLSVLFGQGDGTFRAAAPIALPTGNQPSNVAIADLNGDGRPDLIATDEVAGTVDILLNNGDGSFSAAPTVAIGDASSNHVYLPANAGYLADESDNLAFGDFDGDGKTDIVTVNATDRTVVLLRGNGDGTFSSSTAFAFPGGRPDSGPLDFAQNGQDQRINLEDGSSFLQSFNPATVTAADLNNDGILDLVVGSGQYGNLVLYGNGDGTFRTGAGLYSNPTTIDFDHPRPGATALGDLDGDGRVDIVTAAVQQATQTDGSDVGGVDVLLNAAPSLLPTPSDTVAITRSALAIPVLSLTSGPGTVTQDGSAYTLDLGTIPQGGSAALQFALTNARTEGSTDALQGIFTALASAGYTVTGAASLPTTLHPGDSYTGLAVAAGTATPGQHTQTITFAPRDVSDTVTTQVTLAGTDTDSSVTTSVDGANVAGELPLITLTITDDVVANTLSAPTITGTVAAQGVSDAASLAPFAAVTIADATAGQIETVTVTPAAAANGTLSDPNAATDGSAFAAGALTVAGSAAQVTAALRGLVFTPTAHQVAPGSSVTTSFAITDTDTAGQTATDGTTSVVATAGNDAPVLGGQLSTEATTDQSAIRPFASVSVTDPDVGQTQTALVTLSPAGGGTLSNLGTGLLSADGLSYTVSGTPGAVTTALEGLTFKPTPYQVAPGSSVQTEFALSDTDGIATASNTTLLTATALNDPPVIAGQAATVTTTDEAAVSPFATLTLADPDAGQTQTATVTLSAANGTLGNLGTGTLAAGGLAYTVAGTPGSVQAALRGLVFSAIRATSTTLALSDSDGIITASNAVTVVAAPVTAAILSVTALPASGDYGAGQAVVFTLTASDALIVTGVPLLTLNDGGTAHYLTGSGTRSLVFSTTIAPGQNAATLAVIGSTLPAGATVQNPAGDNADLSGVVATFAGLQVDTTSPAVSSPTLVVAENAAATPIGIAAPTDASAPLTITAGSLPTDGTVFLSDGKSAVVAGQLLTAVDFAGLLFKPRAGAFSTSSAFSYTVADPAGNSSTGTATLAIGAATGNPATTGGTLTVLPGQAATSAGIKVPTDPNYTASQLTIQVTGLPTDGTLDLADGTTAITLNQVLNVGQLTSLTFVAAAGVSIVQSNLTYKVTDPAANAATGSFTLAVGAQPATPPPPAAPILANSKLIIDATMPAVTGTAAPGSLVSLLFDGTVIGTTTADAQTGAFAVAPTTALPPGRDTLTTTATTAGVTSTQSAALTLFTLPDPVGGVSLPDDNSRDIADVIAQGFKLQFVAGTQAVQLLDGTLSTGPGSNEAFLARVFLGALGHSPDPVGVGFADDQLSSNVSYAQLATDILATPEGQQHYGTASDASFVASIAQGLLGRSMSNSDAAAFTNLLTTGTSRGAVLAGIANSAEAQTYLAGATNRVYVERPAAAVADRMFETGLARTPEIAGVQFSTDEQLKSGLSALQVAQEITITQEFQAKHLTQTTADYVSSLYQAGLGHGADAAAITLWGGALDGGQLTRAAVLFGIASSPEAASYLSNPRFLYGG